MLAVLVLTRMSTKRRLAIKQLTARTKKQQQNGSESKCCRTCLRTEELSFIFSSHDTEMKRSYELKLVTGLEIKMNDGLSQKICSKCIEAITFVLQFRRTSRKAEKALLARAGSNNKVKKTYRLQKDTKPLKSEMDSGAVDFGYDAYGDDFHDSYSYEPDVKTVIKQEVRKVRKKRGAGAGAGRCVPHASMYLCAHLGCGKQFRMKATYKAHMRFHTNFCVCESCGKRCRNNNQLQEHKRARHGLGRIHTCAYCDYSAATKEALTIHERRHTGERPYICDHCGASFHRRSNLVQHIAIHLPDKNFQCDMCPKRLKSKKFLQIHKHNAHTGKRYGYLCGVCAHRFEKPNKVRAHTRRVHGVPDDQQGPIARVQL